MNTRFFLIALSLFFAGYSTAQITPGSLDNFIAIYTTGDEGIIDLNQGTAIEVYAVTGYNFTVYWENINNSSENGTNTFISPGDNLYLSNLIPNTDYKVEIIGKFPRIPRPLYGELKELRQWGNIQWRELVNAFSSTNNHNMIMTATDAPDLSQIIPASWIIDIDSGVSVPIRSLAGMFNGCTQFNGDISNWDVSNINLMLTMFQNAKAFNQDISSWDVSNVKNMRQMFKGATAFNQPLNNWNVSNVTNMFEMFRDASSFNQPLNEWNTGNVESMYAMFSGAKSLNQSLGAFTLKSIDRWAVDIADMILETSIDCDNYSSTLVGWANNPNTLDSLNLGSVSSVIKGRRLYSNSPDVVAAHNKLMNDKKWKIPNDKKNTENGCTNSDSGEGGGNPPDGSKNAINELNIEQVTIFPNPSANSLTLNGLQGSTQLIITDINGKNVFSTVTENETEILPISNLVSGMYLLHVHSENVQGTKKFVKE